MQPVIADGLEKVEHISRTYIGSMVAANLHLLVLPNHTTACSLPASAVNATKTMVDGSGI